MTENSANKMEILFVDDDELAHNIIDKYLDDRVVHHAFSAEDAIEFLKEKSVHIVITDIYMDDMDGIAFTKKIKNIRSTVQVIIVSGSAETASLLNALNAGANDFLIKPINKETLLESVRDCEAKVRRWKESFRKIFKIRRK